MQMLYANLPEAAKLALQNKPYGDNNVLGL